jgi:NodT family efflux transporter outer membrane factor (OMF) lipoprotein
MAAKPEPASPSNWSSPLPNEAAWPHEGRLASLVEWWKQYGGPEIATLVEAAQTASPSISSAATRRAQAQAERVLAGSALSPQLDAVGSAQKRSASPPFPAGETFQGAFQVSWEVDVFGGQRAQTQAALWRLKSADAAWHEARVSLAADVVLQTLSWRHCQATLRLVQDDAEAAGRSAALIRRLADAGLNPPDQAALAEAAAADARNRARSQVQRCEADVKALVQYTAWPEARVRTRLATIASSGEENLLAAPLRIVPALPAATLAQRPDVFMAAAAVAAASADAGAQQAQRYPRVGLVGSIGWINAQSSGGNVSMNTWSVGPLSVSLPILDAGRRAALLGAAQARYSDAALQHQAVVRRAVREVEDSLLALDTTAQQESDARLSLQQARAALQAVRQRAEHGLASALQVDEALRRSLSAEGNWLDLQRNRIAAWVSLYRAAGGGWNPDDQLASIRTTP